MTDQTNADLIAELRGFAAGSESARASLMRDAADALEALERDFEELTEELIEHEQGHKAEYEKARALAAVVEKVRGEADYLVPVIGRDCALARILATAPADALREHDAKVRAEALREAYADLQAYTDSGAPFGHRPVEEFLLHRADRIEREAGLK